MKLVIDICNIKDAALSEDAHSMMPLQFFKAHIQIEDGVKDTLSAHITNAGEVFKADQEIRNEKGELGGYEPIDYAWGAVFPNNSMAQETLATFTEKLIKYRGTMPDETEQTTCMISTENGQELFVVSYNFLEPHKLQFIPLSVIR